MPVRDSATPTAMAINIGLLVSRLNIELTASKRVLSLLSDAKYSVVSKAIGKTTKFSTRIQTTNT